MNKEHCFKFHLESLLSPVTVQDFFSNHWETAPLVIKRKSPDYYDSLLTALDLDYVISTALSLQSSDVDLIEADDASKLNATRHVKQLALVYEAYRDGATVRVKHAQRHWKALRTLCRQLEQLFSFPVKANLYCTPTGTRGLNRHWDTHDVLVLQVAGSKRWRIFNPRVPLPLENVPPLAFEERGEKLRFYRGAPGKELTHFDETDSELPLYDFTMEAGDLLYMPRGFVHEANTLESASAHLTIGIHVLTWLDLLVVALGQKGHSDERFRKAMPFGFANEACATDSLKNTFDELLHALAQESNLQNAIEEIAGSFFESRQDLGDGSLMGAGDLSTINNHTFLKRRPGVLCRIINGADTITIANAGSAITLPLMFAATLRFIARTEAFHVREIPGAMTETSKASLVRRLIQNGFLSIA